MTTPTVAANAYTSLAKLHEAATTGPKGALEAPGSSFGSLLKTAMSSLNQTARATDTQTQALAAGKANIVDVVTAVAESEVAIDALVSVRDRVIQSYEEIMKMPI
jgi:flagellar hook-basal body complex protein FliE